MKRAQKLTILQDSLTGQNAALRELQKERLRETMPFLAVSGVISAMNCPDVLLDVKVYHTEANGGLAEMPACEFIRRLADRVGHKKWSIRGSAIALLDAEDSRYDLVPLHALQLTKRNYSQHTIAGGTIGDLRRHFGRSARAVDKSLISLFFDAEPCQATATIHTDLLL